ncbi:hypothetical protein SD77_2147 [Bacillus badius]|uniref:Ribose 5-phosphate isomerase B n=1 Tax=Bacillus badius TaxID=1455 RepID=A0ABR5AYA7_BACBA|nr:hypothetical protein SD78_2387 [Bacillus badius]KIL79693.1 hypothetical protein SD77_2147 [Bacillus badius]
MGPYRKNASPQQKLTNRKRMQKKHKAFLHPFFDIQRF